MGKGQPLDYTKMSPQLADAMKGQVDQAAGIISSLGALQSLTFQGVEPSGADTFLAKFLTGSLLFHIVIDPKGIIAGFGVSRPVGADFLSSNDEASGARHLLDLINSSWIAQACYVTHVWASPTCWRRVRAPRGPGRCDRPDAPALGRLLNALGSVESAGSGTMAHSR